ncbi:MAG: hypothetical protein LBI78_02365 [Campylobacteraceae bacterium]|jgi:predicted phage terminase large subunit-like protein|nr:hypothetical protein [Campylobacteraceae bacterium]
MESNQGQFAVGSASNRKKIAKFFYADLLPTLHPIRGQVVILGTILHIASLLANIVYERDTEDEDEEKTNIHQGEWDTRIYPIIKDGKSMWANRFSNDYIQNLKEMFIKNGLENEFYQEFMCKPFSPDKQFFKQEHFNYFSKILYKEIVPIVVMNDALNHNQISCPQPVSIVLESKTVNIKDCQVYTTMDLASYDGADRTAIVTFALAPDNNIYILDISCGHWTPYEKAVNAIRIQVMFNPIKFGIEKAGALNDFFYTMQTAQVQTGIRVNICPLSHHGKEKNMRIAQLQPYFVTGRIFMNKKQAQTLELEAELLSFSIDVESKHDDLMDALAYMVEFIGNKDMRETIDDDYSGENYTESDIFF